MSNLFKQPYIVNSETQKRVINADERYFRKTTRIIGGNQAIERNTGNSIPKAEEIIDGFLAGLAVEEVVMEPQPSAEDILLQAQVDADGIIASAQAQAAQIRESAKQEAAMLCEQKKQEGYAAGTAQIKAEINAKVSQLETQYASKMQELQMAYESQLETLETDIVDVMIQVFNKVFHIQFENKRQILLHLIKDTLLGVDAGKDFHIRVSDANFKFIESHVADIKEKMGSDANVDVINDMTLSDNDCMIETQTGVFNCGIDMVMDNLEKDIRCLCR